MMGETWKMKNMEGEDREEEEGKKEEEEQDRYTLGETTED